MTLRELIKVVSNDEHLTLIIKNVYYPIQANFINVLRREILDLIVRDIRFNRSYNETAIIVTLKDPEVQADERPRDDDSVGIVWERRN